MFGLYLQLKYGLVLVIFCYTEAVGFFSKWGKETRRTLGQITAPANKCSDKGVTYSYYIVSFVCTNELLADSEWGLFWGQTSNKYFPHILPEWKVICKPLNTDLHGECAVHEHWVYLAWTYRLQLYYPNFTVCCYLLKLFTSAFTALRRYWWNVYFVKKQTDMQLELVHQEHSFTFWLFLSAVKDKKAQEPLQLVLRSKGQCASKRSSSWMGGTFDLRGVTHPVCCYWSRLRDASNMWPVKETERASQNLDKSNKQAVFISAGSEVPTCGFPAVSRCL